MIEALIFDFDGLIIDTEWPTYSSWQETYQRYGAELTIESWLPCLGTGRTTQVFDPYHNLEAQLGKKLQRAEVDAWHQQKKLALIEAQPVLPGVKELITEGKKRGMGIGVASSSSRGWVAGHLERLGLLGYFDALACGDEVAHTKPLPDLYLTALKKLEVQASQAIAFEDSLNGMLAARAAGIFCVVVPNPLTQYLSFGEVDLQLSSLAEIVFDELIEKLA